MLKVLIASSKGGCGKSTIATNLAAWFAHQGKNTALVDTDRQGSSLAWARRRPDGLPPVLGLEGEKRWASKLPSGTDRVVVDAPAAIDAEDFERLAEDVDAVIVPVLPSVIDLEAAEGFVREANRVGRIKRGTVPVAIVANRLKPWTTASQEAIVRMREMKFPVVAELRDSQGYVVLAGLGKSIFDYASESVRSHQDDWTPLLRWIKKVG